VAARVGGLADTVVDANDMALASSAGTGFVFSPVSRETLEIVIDRVAALWRQQVIWRRVQVRAMFTDVSWTRPARRYAALYRELAGHAHAHAPAHAPAHA
jgi:starch synthase